MPRPIPSEQVVPLAAALIRLRGETLSGLARDTGIRAANLSVWLRGRTQVIAERRVAMLLDHLGVRVGELRSDLVHRWRVHGDIADLRLVLGLVLDEASRSQAVIYRCPDEVGMEAVSWLRAPAEKGEAFVRVASELMLNGQAEVSPAALGFGQERISMYSLGTVPTTAIDSAKRELDPLDCELSSGPGMPLARIEPAVSELLANVGASGVSAAGILKSDPGWERLRNALVEALIVGETLDRLADLIRNRPVGER